MPKPKKEEIKKEEPETEISWRAAEFRFVEKGPGWYAIVVLIGLILIILATVQKNFFFAVFILFAGIIILYFGRRRPRVLDFIISNEGVSIGKDVFYHYDDLESFSVYERPQQLNELVLRRKTMINPFVRIPVDSKLSPQVKSFLSQKLSEFNFEPSLIDILADWFGF